MKITMDIPEEFEKHFNNDRFEDSLKRIITDVTDEIELCEMLIKAFGNAEPVKRGRWEYDETRDQHFCSMCENFTIYNYLEEEVMSKCCPECGVEMERK